ncbi:MAG: hypothetical protein A2990_04210 [Candidatus Doudnabacteria bacterium RIFCSPLOWO2_01_FULL_49_40]|nr:MAG: hypothetical protein A2990_04210 [Candidatus Doudnabacteria bacterium RIFCSPLOWO2_01_FULL_49_40]
MNHGHSLAFDWTSVAAAAIGAVIGYSIGVQIVPTVEDPGYTSMIVLQTPIIMAIGGAFIGMVSLAIRREW